MNGKNGRTGREALSRPPPTLADSPKNVVLVTADSLRADYVFGSKAPKSLKTLPWLADDGLAFSNAFSNAGYTIGSFLSILSGTYMWTFDSASDGYGPDRPHVAELLSDVGYATAGFQTNPYLGPTYDYDRGFDYYLGRDTLEDDGVAESAGTVYSRLISEAVTTHGVADVVSWVYKLAGRRLGVQLGSDLYKPAEELNNAVVRWTKQVSRPAFVWVHYMDVHNPYYPHEGTVSEDISRRRAIKLFHKANELQGDTPSNDIDTLESLYRGEIEYLDRQLGDLFERLDETLGLEETVVAFTSDHGEAFNENGHVFHPGYALYDENVHIPLVFRGPNVGEGEIETPVSNVDVVPTLLSTVGVDPPEATDGTDVTSFQDHPPERRRVFSEAWTSEDGHVMVTDGRYKLVRHLRTDEEELYERHGTHGEIRDLSEVHPEVRDRLAASLDEHVRTTGQTPDRGGDVEVTEDVRLQLRKLGYDE